MITSEVKTANKKFRIYRPYESLEDICRTNGANIVRTMIPCFPQRKTHYRFSYVYGVNVRTPRVNSILPFSTAYKYNKEKVEEKLLMIWDLSLEILNLRSHFLQTNTEFGKYYYMLT